MTQEIYKVTRIEEEDFGCEERMEGEPLLVRVTIENKSGESFCIKQRDNLLYERDINEGDFVCFDEDGKELLHLCK